MPQFWNDMLVVTKDELQPWFTDDNLRQTINRYKEKSYGIKPVTRACKNTPLLISYDSLPNEIQLALGDPRKCNHILERYFKIDGNAVRWFKTFRFDDSGKHLKPGHQEQYFVNASVFEALKLLKADRERERRGKGISLTGIYTTLWKDATSFQETLRVKFEVQHTLPENERRFIEAFKRYEEDGYPSLISGKHGNQNTRKVDEQTLELLNNMFAGDAAKPTATDVHRRYDAFIAGYVDVLIAGTDELYDRTQFKKLSDTTVKKYMSQWVNRIGNYQARSTDREKIINEFKVPHTMKKPQYAGSIISIDDRQPPFKAQNGKRVWFYNGIDLGSECFTCCVYGESKEGIIEEFYRQLVRNYHEWKINLPYELECEMSLNSKYVKTFLREGEMFQKVRVIPNDPRQKRIERYFRTLRYEYEKDREGWLARPFAKRESNQAYKEIEKVPMLPYDEIIENSISDIELWNSRKHSKHTHKTRWEVFMEMQHPDIPPTNYLGILPYVGYATETSCNVGRIRLQGKDYLLGIDGKIALGDKLIKLMERVEDMDVKVHWLDDNEGVVFKALVYIGDEYICDAIETPAYNRATLERGEEDKYAISLMSAYEATITTFGKRQKRKIVPVAIIDNKPAEEITFKMPGARRKKTGLQGTGEAMPPIQPNENFDIPTESFAKRLKDRF